MPTALDLERLAVFPLFPLDKSKSTQCGCNREDCKAAGKHPALPWSELEAGEKWSGPEGCGYGIATGHRSGVFVVDLDVRPDKDGVVAFASLGGDEGETFTVRTPTGGFHLYYLLPDFPVRTSGNELAPGIDIRGEHGFVVAPESPHKNGGVYEVFTDVPPTAAPEWLLEWPGLRGSVRSAAREPGVNAPVPVDMDSDLGVTRTKAAIEYCQASAASIEGAQGSVALFRVCLHIVRNLELPLANALDVILQWYNPRCQPPWTESQIQHKLEDARDSSDRIPGVPTEGFLERLGPAQKPPVTERKAHDPAHVYSYTPGLYASSEIQERAPLLKTTRKEMKDGTVEIVTAPFAAPPAISSEELTQWLTTESDAWRGVLRFDEFRQRVWAVDPPLRMNAETDMGFSDFDVAHIKMWVNAQGRTAKKEDIVDAVHAAAMTQSYHPVKEFLEGCEREPGIFETAATRVFNTTDPHADDMLKKMMIGAVRRIYKPGTQVDNMLVLWGPNEGEGKSSFVRVLFGEDFTVAQMPDLSSKDASDQLVGFWACEFAEMDRLIRTENSVAKQFLTRIYDDYRGAYKRLKIRQARSIVFVGTVNDDDWLRGPGRHRRYWPISVGQIDLAWLRDNREALWGEAMFLAAQGEPHFYSMKEEQALGIVRDDFREQDEWQQPVLAFCQGKQEVRVLEAFEAMGGKRIDCNRQQQMRITDIFKGSGFKKRHTRMGSAWGVPHAISEMAPDVRTFSDRMR